jgi:hypothetical protein
LPFLAKQKEIGIVLVDNPVIASRLHPAQHCHWNNFLFPRLWILHPVAGKFNFRYSLLELPIELHPLRPFPNLRRLLLRQPLPLIAHYRRHCPWVAILTSFVPKAKNCAAPGSFPAQ